MVRSEFHYDALREKLKDGIPCPDDFSFPSHVISRWAHEQPDRPALLWVSHDFKDERVVSYKELEDMTHRAAKAFMDAGIKKGDRFVCYFLGLWEFTCLSVRRLTRRGSCSYASSVS